MTLGVVDGAFGDGEGLVAHFAREPFGPGLRGDALQLIDGGRTVDVGAHREDLLFLFFDQVLGELPGARRLTRALQTREKDHGGGLHVEAETAFLGREVAPDHGGEFALHDAHERLARIEVSDDLFAHGLLFDAGENFPHDGQRDVGFKERKADLAQHFFGVRLRQTRLTAHGFDDFGETLGQ